MSGHIIYNGYLIMLVTVVTLATAVNRIVLSRAGLVHLIITRITLNYLESCIIPVSSPGNILGTVDCILGILSGF